MDRLESLGNQLSQITMYDIKSMYNQAKNIVLNVSETEAKVQEATNDEPWGASSTLMQDIAQGTFNFQQFNETMPAIYSRFMEKEARQWRQIYKALQLLEYLIKNGSERVVDDARSHLSTIKMLRNFHYVDEKGKDQGINVRNRAREIAELLSDLDRVRQERRKAKQNRSKYIGTGNDAGMSFSSGGGRYGGFGSESGGYSGSYDRDYAGGSSSGGGGGSSGGFRDTSSRKEFEEYDAGDWEDRTPQRSNSLSVTSSSRREASTSNRTSSAPKPTTAEPSKPATKQPEVNLIDDFGFDDVSAAPTVAAPAAQIKPLAAPANNASVFDDDFDEFQSAPPSAAFQSAPAPAPSLAAKPMSPNVFQVLAASPPRTSSAPPSQPSFGAFGGFGAAPLQPQSATTGSFGAFPPSQPQYKSSAFGTSSTPLSPTTPTVPMGGMRGPSQLGGAAAPKPASKPASSGNFDDLWSMSLGGAGGASNKAAAGAAGANKSIKDLEREKAQASIWGGVQAQGQGQSGQQRPGNFGMGMGSSAGFGGSASGGGDDLLL
ncbi:hypothetical protein BOTBODRAFT_179949 [Botryobasidium botryosum FD-172 SS1]|uniref:ENTH domain-containing protein n=1 Tax=Botryobasidium botryosum (strain FD-172 SS1) TaxID=930990 RepID=A0A067M0Y2_BOTB1|nr:hypothetical protein BOTBODRAFT_179949 [Botryobasidium botryosum FD-172 SS1]